MCRNSSGLIDVETRYLVLRLEDWLSDRCRSRLGFMENVFLRSPAGSRLNACVHNPAYLDETKFCHRFCTKFIRFLIFTVPVRRFTEF